jgi:hypothetical protein
MRYRHRFRGRCSMQCALFDKRTTSTIVKHSFFGNCWRLRLGSRFGDRSVSCFQRRAIKTIARGNRDQLILLGVPVSLARSSAGGGRSTVLHQARQRRGACVRAAGFRRMAADKACLPPSSGQRYRSAAHAYVSLAFANNPPMGSGSAVKRYRFLASVGIAHQSGAAVMALTQRSNASGAVYSVRSHYADQPAQWCCRS